MNLEQNIKSSLAIEFSRVKVYTHINSVSAEVDNSAI